jgi:hypothetical protein
VSPKYDELSRYHLEHPGIPQALTQFPYLIPPEVSLSCSRQPATCLCPESDESIPLYPFCFFRSILILSSHQRLYLTSCLAYVPAPKTLRAHFLSPIRATWPADPINLDLMTRKIFGMRSAFPTHSDLDLFIVAAIEKETCPLELVASDFSPFPWTQKCLIVLSCIAAPKGAPDSPQ